MWLESTRPGKLLLSVLVTAVVVMAVIQNLPAGGLKHKLTPVRTAALAAGLDQYWSMFAPEPYRINVHVVAEISYSDGSRGRWSVPRNGPLLGGYRDFRWRKYDEELRKDSYSHLWRPLAEWIVRRERARGRRPVRVTLVRRWYDLRPPGPGPDRGPWQRQAFSSLVAPGAP
jgi:hypothetical protein